MEVIYRAFDGKDFKDKLECENYEWSIINKDGAKDIILRDSKGNILEDILNEDNYNNAETIEVLSDIGLSTLEDIADYTGFENYYDVDDIGLWKWEEDKFVKVEENNAED